MVIAVAVEGCSLVFAAAEVGYRLAFTAAAEVDYRLAFTAAAAEVDYS